MVPVHGQRRVHNRRSGKFSNLVYPNAGQVKCLTLYMFIHSPRRMGSFIPLLSFYAPMYEDF